MPIERRDRRLGLRLHDHTDVPEIEYELIAIGENRRDAEKGIVAIWIGIPRIPRRRLPVHRALMRLCRPSAYDALRIECPDRSVDPMKVENLLFRRAPSNDVAGVPDSNSAAPRCHGERGAVRRSGEEIDGVIPFRALNAFRVAQPHRRILPNRQARFGRFEKCYVCHGHRPAHELPRLQGSIEHHDASVDRQEGPTLARKMYSSRTFRNATQARDTGSHFEELHVSFGDVCKSGPVRGPIGYTRDLDGERNRPFPSRRGHQELFVADHEDVRAIGREGLEPSRKDPKRFGLSAA